MMLFLLGRRGVRSACLAAFAWMTVSGSAHAFCRTTTGDPKNPIPPNYNPALSGCYTEGLLVFWKNACIGYSINENATADISYDEAKRIIDLSFQTWMDGKCPDTGEPAGISVSDLGPSACDALCYNSDGSANQNLIVFREDGWPYKDANSTLALTTVTFNANTGEIYDADMELNASGHNLSTAAQPPHNGYDLQSVVTHEAGHFLGLAHATNRGSTMFASYLPGTTSLRAVTADDMAGLCAIYPDTRTRTVSPSVSSTEVLAADACNATPFGGLATSCVCTEGQPSSKSKSTKSSCDVVPNPAGVSWGAHASAALMVTGLVFARRKRRPRA